MDGRMKRQTSGPVDRRIKDGRIGGRTAGGMDRWINGRIDQLGWMDGWMDRLMDRQMVGWTGYTDRWIDR